MTYTHLTTNELVTIEAYYQENIIKINHNHPSNGWFDQGL